MYWNHQAFLMQMRRRPPVLISMPLGDEILTSELLSSNLKHYVLESSGSGISSIRHLWRCRLFFSGLFAVLSVVQLGACFHMF